MEIRRKVEHKFDLRGFVPGEWFLGCDWDWFRYPTSAAGINECPRCGRPLSIFYVTEDDVR